MPEVEVAREVEDASDVDVAIADVEDAESEVEMEPDVDKDASVDVRDVAEVDVVDVEEESGVRGADVSDCEDELSRGKEKGNVNDVESRKD